MMANGKPENGRHMKAAAAAKGKQRHGYGNNKPTKKHKRLILMFL